MSIPSGALYRIRDDIFVKILISAFIAFLISRAINFDSILYSMQEPTNSNISGLDCVGYPADEEVIRANSIEEIKQNRYFTIKINKSDLKPTNYYRKVAHTYEGGYSSSRKDVLLWRMDGKAYGRYYVATLNSGENIILFLDEKALSLNTKSIILPIGEVSNEVSSDWFEAIQKDYNIKDVSWFVDMTNNNWRVTGDGSKVATLQNVSMIIIFFATYIISSFIFVKMGWTPKKSR